MEKNKGGPREDSTRSRKKKRNVQDTPTSAISSQDELDPHLQFFKTRLCPFLSEGCRKGSECTYAHTNDELRPSLNLTKTKLCYAYIRGKCDQTAVTCRYAHGHSNLRSTPQYYKTQLCKFWSVNVRCPGGKYCRHAHGLEELRTLLAYENNETPVPLSYDENKEPKEHSFNHEMYYENLGKPPALTRAVPTTSSCTTRSVPSYAYMPKIESPYENNMTKHFQIDQTMQNYWRCEEDTYMDDLHTPFHRSFCTPNISRPSTINTTSNLNTPTIHNSSAMGMGYDMCMNKNTDHMQAHDKLRLDGVDHNLHAMNNNDGFGADALMILFSFLESKGMTIWNALEILQGAVGQPHSTRTMEKSVEKDNSTRANSSAIDDMT